MLPNLIVIGAQKAGTASLHRYLDLHPEVSMSNPKELDFFGGSWWNWDRGLGWYESHFMDDTRFRGESSTSYSWYPYVRGVPERMSEIVPEARFIYLVRDPVERMISQYIHAIHRGTERRPVEQALADAIYTAQSRYHAQLERYLARFDRSQFLVLDTDDLLRRREPTLQRVFRFLGVDESFRSPEFAAMFNPSSDRSSPTLRRGRRLARKLAGPAAGRVDAAFARAAPRPRLDPDLRRRLTARFATDASRLRSLTGQRFDSWSV